MILADTSVWISHFRRRLPSFYESLSHGQIVIHTVIIGELATGNLARRNETLAWLGRLPRVKEASPAECLTYIEQRRLFGLGLGWSDVQLLAAADLSRSHVWSLDKKLAQVARQLRLA